MSNTTQTGHLQPCGHPPSTYCDHCLFRTSDNTSDIVLVVEGQKLYFNKSLLSMCSPVFSRMFAGDFKEKEAEEVKLPGKTLKSMVLFFKQLHPVYAAVTPVTDEDLLPLLALADEYQVDHVKTKCDMYIGSELNLAAIRNPTDVGSHLSTNRIMGFLMACEQYGLQKHRTELVRLASQRNCADLKSGAYFPFVPATAIKDVALKRCEALEMENHALRDNVRTYQQRLQTVRENSRTINKRRSVNDVLHNEKAKRFEF